MKPDKHDLAAIDALLQDPNASPDTVYARIDTTNNKAYKLTEDGLAAMFNVTAGKLAIVEVYRELKGVRDELLCNIYTLRPTSSPPYAVVIRTDDETLKHMQGVAPERIVATSRKGPLGLLLGV